ncbi:MAG: L,D-transpeptidase [Aquisalimonadaceae bacterium]
MPTLIAGLLTVLLAMPLPGFAKEDALPATQPKWLLVDTTSQHLVVYQGEAEIARYSSIAIGRNGASQDRFRNDNTTPLGEFRISWINHDSQYHIFLGFDFPTFDHASRAYAAGRLSLDDYLQISDAARLRRLPPQTTGLGGHIGIHGLGDADPDIHRIANWTRGCIALTDDEIRELAELVTIGTRVIVR